MNKKVCVITGSSSGIGATSAILFSQRGWDVCVNYSKEALPAEKVAAACKAHGADVLVERADVADDAQCVRLAKRTQDRFGRCDALVNNAGTTKFVDLKDLDGLDANDFQRTLNALTLSLARVLGPEVRVNAVAPGMVDSPWLKVGLGAVASRTTGEVHVVDGGRRLGRL